MIVDVHCHHLPPKVVDAVAGLAFGGRNGERVLLRDGQRLGPVDARLTDLSILLEESDRFGVDVRALCTPSWLHCYTAEPAFGVAFARAMNDAMADAVREHPARLVGLATVPLQDVDAAIVELERAIRDLGMRGVATATHVNDRYFDDPALWPFLEAAADLDVPVFVHPTEVAGAQRMDRYRLIQMIGNPHEATLALVRTILGGVLDRLPDLTLCAVQVGGSLPALIGRIDHTWRVRPEARAHTAQPPSAYLPRLYYDSIAHSAEPIDLLLRHVPVDRVLMGSDYPWDMGETEPGRSLRQVGDVTPEALARMLGGNASQLLRIGAGGA